MCISICGEIMELYGCYAIVDIMGVDMKVNIELIEDPMIGDNLVIHSGYAIEKVSKEYSNEILDIFKEFDNEL